MGYLLGARNSKGGPGREALELSRRSQAINKIILGWTSAVKKIKLSNRLDSNGKGKALLEEIILN